MHIKFYSILGKFEDYENFLKSTVNELRDILLKKGGNPEKISLTLIRIRQEVIDEILRLLKEDESKIPQNLRYLILTLRQDSVSAIPAILVNGKKIAEGQLPPQEELKSKIIEEFEKEFNIKVFEEKKEEVIEVPQPREVEATQVTPIQPPTPSAPEAKPTTKPLIPIATPIVEVETQQKPSMLVFGKPENCNDCLYYGPLTRTCALLGVQVKDIHKPPCRHST